MARQAHSAWIDPSRSDAKSPAAAYLASIGKGSRRTMHQALTTLAKLIVAADEVERDAVDPMKLRWENLRRPDTARLHSELKTRFAPSTANKMLSALRGVLRTCRDTKRMSEADFQAAASLEQVKASTKSYREVAVNTEVVRRLFAACVVDLTASGRRDAAMLAIFLSSGLRRAEAAIVDIGDYDPGTGRLHIRGERPEYDRFVTLGPPARRAMRDWLEIRGSGAGPLLLPVDRGGIIRFRRMTDQAIYDIFSRITGRAGVKGVSPRDMRRAYAVSLVRAKKSVAEVQYLIGHASWFTASTYQALARSGVDEGYDIEHLPYEPPKGQRR